VRESHPRACSYILDFSEVEPGRWNADLSGSIWSELPTHAVLVTPRVMAGWPRPLRALDPDQAKPALTGCEWMSDAAKRRLGMAVALPGSSAPPK
jgi:hypothetical protein